MKNTVYKVWVTYTTDTGRRCKSMAALKATMVEALELVASCRHTYTIAQEYGRVKFFTIHMEEQHLEPSRKED